MPIDLEQVRSRAPGRDVFWHPVIDSTMNEAVRLSQRNCASGTVVGADEQTAGQGRWGRTWHSEKDSGLYFSVVLRLPIDMTAIPVLTFALGLAAASAIHDVAGVACDLRWPNDVLIRERKCAGILTQLHPGAVVAGIGINVNQSEFPTEVASIATSLRIETGRLQSRELLLAALLEEIDHHSDILARRGVAAILDLFQNASSYVAGRRVTVDLPEGPVTGVTAGLNEAGFLRLRRDDGGEEMIVAGGVRPAEN